MKYDETLLPRKWSVYAGNRRIVVKKRPFEREEHVYMKIFIWALYLPEYPFLEIERSVDRRYKPDVVSVDEEGKPKFWAEAGHVSTRKLRWLLKRLPDTHLVFAKWAVALEPFISTIETHFHRSGRNGIVDVISFPQECGRRCVNERGIIHISFSDIQWKRI